MQVGKENYSKALLAEKYKNDNGVNISTFPTTQYPITQKINTTRDLLRQ